MTEKSEHPVYYLRWNLIDVSQMTKDKQDEA